MSNSKIPGIILIILGCALLLDAADVSVFSWYFIRSYGFILIGALLFNRGVSHPRHHGLYAGTFLFLLGLYFVLPMYDLYELERGLTFSLCIIIAGISFYSLFLFKDHDWGYLLYGSFIALLGFLFFFAYLNILPVSLLAYWLERFWPVLLIIFGFLIVIHSLIKNKITGVGMEAESAPNSNYN